MTWFKVYLTGVFRLFVSPSYYILIAGVLVGGHSPKGKAIVIVGLTIIMPMLGVLYGKVIQDNEREGYSHEYHL